MYRFSETKPNKINSTIFPTQNLFHHPWEAVLCCLVSKQPQHGDKLPMFLARPPLGLQTSQFDFCSFVSPLGQLSHFPINPENANYSEFFKQVLTWTIDSFFFFLQIKMTLRLLSHLCWLFACSKIEAGLFSLAAQIWLSAVSSQVYCLTFGCFVLHTSDHTGSLYLGE